VLLLAGACDDEPARLVRPNILAVGPAGELFVADGRSRRIAVFDTAGRFVRQVGRTGMGPDELWSIRGMDCLADGAVVVLNGSYSDPDDRGSAFAELKVLGLDGKARLAASIGPLRVDPPVYPVDTAVLPEGFAVPDTARGRIDLFDRTGKRTGAVHEIEGGPPLKGPNSVVYAAGQLWITEYKAHRVRRVTLDGRQTLLLQEEGEEPGQMLFPYAVAVSAAGWFVVADLGNYRIQRFDGDGKWLGLISPKPVEPEEAPQLMDVAVGPDGRIFVADSRAGRVLVYRTDGTLLRVIDRLGQPPKRTE